MRADAEVSHAIWAHGVRCCQRAARSPECREPPVATRSDSDPHFDIPPDWWIDSRRDRQCRATDAGPTLGDQPTIRHTADQ
jgi:hypothetical protein